VLLIVRFTKSVLWAVGFLRNNPIEAVFLVRLQAPSDISSPSVYKPPPKTPNEAV